MPSLNFVLPHWMYWGTLILFPLIAMYLVKRQREHGAPHRVSLFIAYLFWITSGFMGLHRFYLRSLWGFIFLPVFLFILYANGEIRDHREDVSRTRAALEATHVEINRAQIRPGVTATPEMTARLDKARKAETVARANFATEERRLEEWRGYSRWLALLMLAMMIADAFLIPREARRINRIEAQERAHAPPETPIPDIPPAGTHEDPTIGLHTRITDAIEWVNIRVGWFVAYWAVISVFVYYYEVIARFVFNSPTNWVHESMFLMYGMQYMLAGAYAYREDQHVRVDVIYTQFSPRGKAYADIFTSFFFFIFIGVMFYTSWIFAWSAVNPGGFGEVSFTEWAVQYWPVKLTMPVGAGLLLLQGVAKLIKDIVFVTQRRA